MSKARDKAKKEKKARERKAKALRARERTLGSKRATKEAETRVLTQDKRNPKGGGPQASSKPAGRVTPGGGHRTQGK